MTAASHDLIARFFADLSRGAVPETLFTPDAAVWTLNTRADTPAAVYTQGTAMLLSLFPDGLAYQVKAITAEADRAAAEVSARGVLHDGQVYDNEYVFLFRIADGKVAHLAEYFDTAPVNERIMPLLMTRMGAAAG